MIVVRDLRYGQIGVCAGLVESIWGEEAADRARAQMIAMFDGFNNSPPQFYVAMEGDEVLGFAGFRLSWVMKDAYELIWIATFPKARRMGIGSVLTRRRLAEIERRKASMVFLVTKEVDFFERFGFDSARVIDGHHFMIKPFRNKVGI